MFARIGLLVLMITLSLASARAQEDGVAVEVNGHHWKAYVIQYPSAQSLILMPEKKDDPLGDADAAAAAVAYAASSLHQVCGVGKIAPFPGGWVVPLKCPGNPNPN